LKIFIDVDNTIIEHYGFYSITTESRVHKSIGKFPMQNMEAIKYMYKTSVCRDPERIKKLFDNDNVYILTKFASKEYEVEKQKRIANLLGMSHEELINKNDSKGIKKYIAINLNESKVETVKSLFKIKDIENLVLIDDYSANIIEWENAGGIGIKYYNEYNSPQHPMNGISISNFKLLTMGLENKNKNIMLVALNKYKLNLIEKNLLLNGNAQKLNLLECVIKDLKEKLKVNELKDIRRHNNFEFLVDYYKFMENINEDYWVEKINEETKDFEKILLTSNFEPNFENILHGSKNEFIKINVISTLQKEKTNTYDVYVNINEESSIDNIEEKFERVTDVIEKILKFK